jgi:hypothetical protein
VELTKTNIGKMEAQLKQWGATLDGLVAKAKGTGAETKQEYKQRVDEVQAKHRAAQSKLAGLKAAGGEKWGALKSDMESAWKDLEAAFRRLKN